MWSKIMIYSLAVLLFCLIALPAIAFDDRIRMAMETEPGDEHPWGGDRNDDDNPVVIGGLSSISPDLRQPNMFLIYGAERTWLFIRNVATSIISHPQSGGGSTTGSTNTITSEAGNN